MLPPRSDCRELSWSVALDLYFSCSAALNSRVWGRKDQEDSNNNGLSSSSRSAHHRGRPPPVAALLQQAAAPRAR